MKNVIIGALAVIAVGALSSDALLYQRYSSARPLVTIDGKAIRKKDYQDALDAQTQGGVLKKMVFSQIVTNAAAKKGLTPSDKDVDARLADMERRDPSSLGDAAQNPAHMAQLRQDIKTDLALTHLRTAGVQVSDAEVAAFYAANQRGFALPAQVKTTMAVAENAVDAATATDLLRQGTPEDVIARQPRMHIVGRNGFQVNLAALPPAQSGRINRSVYAMKPGAVQTFPAGKVFLVVRVDKKLPAGVPPLGQIKAQVAELARLQKAPTAGQEIATLYQAAHVTFDVDKYAAYFQDVQNAPTIKMASAR